VTPPVDFCASRRNIVSERPRLGHIISRHCLDDADIFHRHNSMVGQTNSVLCYFGKLPSFVKSKLLYAYCSSLYGCELWDLWNNNIDIICVAWRKAFRRVWNLPFNTHCDILYELSNIRFLYSMLYANECYLLLLGVLIVTAILLKLLLGMQFYMVT